MFKSSLNSNLQNKLAQSAKRRKIMATFLKKIIWAPYAYLIDFKLFLLPFQDLMSEILLALNLQPGQNVLDAGCGTGNLCHYFDSKNKGRIFFTGIDISETMLKKARAKNLDSNFKWQQVDLNQKLPFSEGCFDAVCCCHALYNLVQPKLALAEFFRVLKPGGILAVATPRTNNPAPVLPEHFKQIFRRRDWFCLAKTCFYLPWFALLAVYNLLLSMQSTASRDFFYTAKEMAELLAQANFQQIKIRPVYAGVDILAVAKKEVENANIAKD